MLQSKGRVFNSSLNREGFSSTIPRFFRNQKHAILIIDSQRPYCLMLLSRSQCVRDNVLFKSDCTRKGKPVARQGRKAIESPNGDRQAAERHRRGNGSPIPPSVCLLR